MKDIAELAGVSKFTVSMALNGSDKIRNETKKRVREAARKLGYKKNGFISAAMSAMKSKKTDWHQETVALLYTKSDTLEIKPTFPEIVSGIKSEADRLGYCVEEFYIDARAMSPQKLDSIFKSRNIRGAIMTGLLDKNMFPKQYARLAKKYNFISAGLRTKNPEIDFVITDQFLISYYSTLKIIEYGYKRPGLATTGNIDLLIDGRFTGGFLRGQINLDEKSRIPPFLYVEKDKERKKKFFHWLKKYKPDAILCLESYIKEWLEEAGLKVPRDIGLATLEVDERRFAGMKQKNRDVGIIAMQNLSDILHRNILTRKNSPAKSTIIRPHWVNAYTLPKLQQAGSLHGREPRRSSELRQATACTASELRSFL